MSNKEKQNLRDVLGSIIILPFVIYSLIKSAYLDEEDNLSNAKKIATNKHKSATANRQNQRS